MGFFDLLKKLKPKHNITPEPIKFTEDMSVEEYQALRNDAYELFDSLYDTDTVEGIRKIPVPEYEVSRYEGFTCKPEYILDLRATAHKKEGNLDLAIECLKKANELRDCSQYMYTAKDYNRLVEYLKLARRFDEVKEAEEKIKRSSIIQFDDIKQRRQEMYDRIYGEFNSDLVEVGYISSCCPICAKYRGRVFSLRGEDKRFPLFPKDFHEDCGLHYSPFVYGMSYPVYCNKDEVIEFSNRPFVDDRTKEQKEGYQRILQEKEENKQREIDRVDYNWLWENIPEICPKTFNAYRRMKKSNSKGYIKLQEQKQHWIEYGHIEKSVDYIKLSESDILSFKEHLKDSFAQFDIQSEILEWRESEKCVEFDITAPEGMRIKELQALKDDIDIRTPEASIEIVPDFQRGVIVIKALYKEKS